MIPEKKVLIVDDDESSRRLVRSILQTVAATSFKVVEASGGVECLRRVEAEGPFDLVLLDVEMQDLDGYAVCEAIRRVDSTVPVVFVTACSSLAARAAGRQAGGDSYLVKPIRQAPLVSLVNLMTRAGMRRPAAPGRA
jgi:DNA-binding response OmpR family regulator